MQKKFIVNQLENFGVLKGMRFLNRYRPRILMYHRIVDNKDLPGIDPQDFEQQLIYIKKHFHPISINELIDNPFDRLHNRVVVTFDDGHADFYTTAWPLLKHYQIPTTLFITTGFVDQICWLWPDLLRHIILTTRVTQLNLGELGQHSLADGNKLILWNILGDYCLSLSTETRMAFIRDLAISLDVAVSARPLEPFNAVTWNNLREMQREGLDIGSHSVTHPLFTQLNTEELETELTLSQQRIHDELGVKARGICYPNGMPKDTSAAVEHAAKKYYDYGVVAYPAPNSPNNKMHLGRLAARANLSYFKWTLNWLPELKKSRGEY